MANDATRPVVAMVSQAVLDVDSRRGEDDFAPVRDAVVGWLRRKVGHDLPAAMAAGESETLDQLGASRCETVSLSDPLLWAFRHDDPDSEVPQRTWVTEGSLAFIDGRLCLAYRLHLINRGEPAPFQRSVPRFVREVAAKQGVCLDGRIVSATAARARSDPDVDDLLDLLGDGGRSVPVVAISSVQEGPDGEKLLLDADRVAGLCLGTAHVFALSRQASLMLTARVGKKLSVFHGGARIWHADRAVVGGDPYDHPLYLGDRIRRDGAATSSEVIVREVLRISASRPLAKRVAPSFSEIRRAATATGREAAVRAGRAPADLLPLYEADNQQLQKQVAELKSDYEVMEAYARSQFEAVLGERDDARDQIASLNARISHLSAALRDRESLPEIELPDDFDDLEAWATLHLGSDVQLAPRAIRAAQDSEFHDPALAYQSLLLLKNAYIPMRRSGSEGARTLWLQGLETLGLSESATFAGDRANQFGDDYFVRWEGRRCELERHLKGNNSRKSKYCFRLYFFYCDKTRRVVVGSFPKHLPNDMT